MHSGRCPECGRLIEAETAVDMVNELLHHECQQPDAGEWQELLDALDSW
jgi:hypothetical protein